MSKHIVLVGHAHACPQHGMGAVVSGAAGFTCNGNAVACVGDKTSCGARIVSGSAGVTIDGKEVACVGDRTDHNGELVEGEPMVSIG